MDTRGDGSAAGNVGGDPVAVPSSRRRRTAGVLSERKARESQSEESLERLGTAEIDADGIRTLNNILANQMSGWCVVRSLNLSELRIVLVLPMFDD